MRLYIQGVILNEDGEELSQARYTFRNENIHQLRKRARRMLGGFDDGVAIIMSDDYQEVIGSDLTDDQIDEMIQEIDEKYED